MSESLQKQQKALVDYIKDADKKEKQRLKRLASEKHISTHKQLLERYDKERKQEREKIQYLTNDLFTLKQKIDQGEINDGFLSERKEFKRTAHQRGIELGTEEHHNRFERLETLADQTFHTAVINKFDNYDKRFEKKQAYQPFDNIKETQKLRLLEQKRNVLRQLIHVQEVEQSANTGVPMITSQRNHSFSRPYDTSSMASSGVSSLTYATFASHKPPPTSRINPLVPRLKIG